MSALGELPDSRTRVSGGSFRGSRRCGGIVAVPVSGGGGIQGRDDGFVFRRQLPYVTEEGADAVPDAAEPLAEQADFRASRSRDATGWLVVPFPRPGPRLR